MELGLNTAYGRWSRAIDAPRGVGVGGYGVLAGGRRVQRVEVAGVARSSSWPHCLLILQTALSGCTCSCHPSLPHLETRELRRLEPALYVVCS